MSLLLQKSASTRPGTGVGQTAKAAPSKTGGEVSGDYFPRAEEDELLEADLLTELEDFFGVLSPLDRDP